MKIFLATNNNNKKIEIESIFGSISNEFEIVDDYFTDIEETSDTLEGNALLKAEHGYKQSGIPTISDDTGLVVDALNGAPGVYSARYAGKNCSYADNVNKLLLDMKNIDKKNRTAIFKTVVTYVSKDLELVAEGSVKGLITRKPYGRKGFGYDPIFYVFSENKTFAEMNINEKQKCSHRGNAIANLKQLFKDKNIIL